MIDAKSIIAEIRQKRVEAAIDLGSVDIRLRAGAEGTKRAAELALSALQATYLDGIIGNALIIAVNGPGAAKFAEIAESFKYTTVNYMKAADDVYANVIKRGGRDIYATNEHWMVMDELNRLKLENKIVSLPPIQANFVDIGFEKPLRPSIHFVFSRHYGGQLYSIVSKTQIGKKALSIEFDGNVLPVILYNYLIDLDTKILPEPFVVIKVEENPTEEYVKKTLSDIKKACKAKINAQTKGGENE
jgi:hypothetical protein